MNERKTRFEYTDETTLTKVDSHQMKCFTVKTKPRFGECYTCVVGVNPIRGCYVFFFSRQAYVQPYHSKGLGKIFLSTWLNIGLS